MNCIVSGGAGFIGSHLCESLLKQGHTVICLDNFITGDKRNIQELQAKYPDKFTLLNHDITHPLEKEALKNFPKINQIYHLACPASPVDIQEIPLQTLWISAGGTKNMLELANKFGAAFLLSSSSEIYGDALENPQKETYWGNVNPVGVKSCYAEGKRFAESLAINYYNHYQFPLAIVRIFDVYGPKMRKFSGQVIANFIQAALKNEPLRIFGDSKQTRSFCYIDDIIQGIILAMNHREFIGPVNLGYPEEISLQALAEKIIRLTDSQSIISHQNLVKNDLIIAKKPDLALAQNSFGFEPKITLQEGLKKVIEYFKQLG